MNRFETIETEQIVADLSKVVDRIKRQYEDLPKAFQKEAIQNAWDARRKEETTWMVKIDTYAENKMIHLIIEDYSTTGMNEEKLDAFLSLWKPRKEHLDAGGQGQGKFVLMAASNDNILIVETISMELPYKCRFLQEGKKDRGDQNYSIKNFIPSVQPLNHKGTKVWVYNVKEDFLRAIKLKEFADSIIESWWQILGDRFNAKIYLLDKVLTLPQLPSPQEERILLENKRLGNVGRIKRLVLTFYEEPIPEIFQGVRIQRANMMITKIPFEIHKKEYQNRFSGCVEFDNDLETALKDIEKTDHCGFLHESLWKEIKGLVRDKAGKFINEIIPQKRPAIQLRNLNKIIQKANQIIHENCPEVEGTGPVVPPIPPKPKPALRIKYLMIRKKEVKYGDVIRPHCCIINENKDSKKILLKVHLKRRGNIITKEEYKFAVDAGKQKPIKLSEIELKKDIFPKGKYTIRATIEENRHDIDTKATSFYLEIKREPVRKGFIKGAEFREVDEPIRNYPINKGVITINLAHEDFVNVFSSFGQKPRKRNKQIGFYLIKICIDEATNELYKIRLKSPNKDLDDLINEISRVRDKMYYEVYA